MRVNSAIRGLSNDNSNGDLICDICVWQNKVYFFSQINAERITALYHMTAYVSHDSSKSEIFLAVQRCCYKL